MTTGLDILQAVERYTGVPYYEGNPQGVPPAARGMDCSGIVQRGLADIGITVPRTTSTQLTDAMARGKIIGTNLAAAQQGDILHYVGHEEVWIGNGMVFSESIPGTTAAIRPRTPWPIVGIARYADGGPGPMGGATGPVGSQASGSAQIPLIYPAWFQSFLDSTGLTGIITFVKDIGSFISAVGNPNFWERVALAFLGVILLALGLYGLTHAGNVITVTSQMVKKGADIAGQS